MRFLLTSLFVVASGLASAAEPKAVVEGKVAEIKAIVATDKTDEGVRSKVTAVFESFTDFEEFSRQTLKTAWDKLTPPQKALFVDKYRQLLHKSYIKHFKANRPLEVVFRTEVEVVGDKALVPTSVTSGDTKADVDYKLTKSGETWKVYDLEIDAVSLMRSYRKQFTKIYETDGFDALIKKIEERIAKGDTKIN